MARKQASFSVLKMISKNRNFDFLSEEPLLSTQAGFH
uniref:Uncharacterized protein n=1 Tax=Anguilla anguilla TaxID=7936 RepID=A0A0E9UQM1_ANGAN